MLIRKGHTGAGRSLRKQRVEERSENSLVARPGAGYATDAQTQRARLFQLCSRQRYTSMYNGTNIYVQ